MTIRELVKSEIDTLPEESLYAVQEFVLLQKERISNAASPQKENDIARRRAAYQQLLKYHKTLPADFDYQKERLEALDEKYGFVD